MIDRTVIESKKRNRKQTIIKRKRDREMTREREKRQEKESHANYTKFREKG